MSQNTAALTIARVVKTGATLIALILAFALSIPGPTTSKSAPPSENQQTLWRAGMERGDMYAWYHPSGPAWSSGGEFNGVNARTFASTARARSGLWSTELRLPTGAGDARLFRWKELREHRTTTNSVWLYFPRRYTASTPIPWWNVMQIVSRRADDQVQPIWHLDIQNGRRGAMRVDLVWWHRTLQGPHEGQVGYRRFRARGSRLPVGRWFRLTLGLTQSSGFDGRVRVWKDDRLLFDRREVRTSFVNCSFNPWCAANEWSVNNYTAGVSPAPARIFADDARITTELPDCFRRPWWEQARLLAGC